MAIPSASRDSALEAIRSAMQELLDGWLSSSATPDRLITEITPAATSGWVYRALAQVSRWTCVQWGVEAGWWALGEEVGEDPPQAATLVELRERGARRLAGWFPFDDGSSGQVHDRVNINQVNIDQEAVEGLGLGAARGDEVWRWIVAACERVRAEVGAGEPGGGGFAGLVSTFENALQIVGELRDGRWLLEVGKANSAHARRRSGSYYTPRRIVQSLVDQTLPPALQLVVVREGEIEPPLRVLDPACGAGLFLVEVAQRLTEIRRASFVSPETCPPQARLFEKTVNENIFGVDRNPLAVDWCRLWLWSLAADPRLELDAFARNVRVGDSLVGAPSDAWRGGPPAAWTPTELDDRQESRRWRTKHQRELVSHALECEPTSATAARVFADGWCAVFFVPKLGNDAEETEAEMPTYGALTAGALESSDSAVARRVRAVAKEHRFFHWHLEFPDVFRAGGFDVILGNPPWIAHAGRAAQSLHPRLKFYLATTYRAFSGYPTTHGLFVERAAGLLKEGGRLGLVLPSSVSELGGYEATRGAHDAVCAFELDLTDFGEGCFPGVTQPCMALVSRRVAAGRDDAVWGAPWPVARDDLDQVGRDLLLELAALPRFEPELFGERGIQSDQRLKEHLRAGPAAHERFGTPLREGADIREFSLGPPRLWADWPAMGKAARDVAEYTLVRFVVRQTASYTIASLYDGLPFRNSLLAGFASERWRPEVMVALLNSSLLRWHHHMSHRDARQPVLPQVKVGHLRAIPAPPFLGNDSAERLCRLTQEAQQRGALDEAKRHELEEIVREAYGLAQAQHQLVLDWSRVLVNKTKRRAAP